MSRFLQCVRCRVLNFGKNFGNKSGNPNHKTRKRGGGGSEEGVGEKKGVRFFQKSMMVGGDGIREVYSKADG